VTRSPTTLPLFTLKWYTASDNFYAESASGRILKIGQLLLKLRQKKKGVRGFYDSRCILPTEGGRVQLQYECGKCDPRPRQRRDYRPPVRTPRSRAMNAGVQICGDAASPVRLPRDGRRGTPQSAAVRRRCGAATRWSCAAELGATALYSGVAAADLSSTETAGRQSDASTFAVSATAGPSELLD